MSIPDTRSRSGSCSPLEREPPAARADGLRSSRSRARSSRAGTGRPRRRPPRRTSRASCARAEHPRRSPRRTLPEGDPVHLPAALATAFGLSTSEARRLIGQGGVKLGRRGRPRARRSPRGPPRRDPAGRQATLHEVSRARRRLTVALVVCYCSSAARKGRRRKVPVLDLRSASKPDRIRSRT